MLVAPTTTAPTEAQVELHRGSIRGHGFPPESDPDPRSDDPGEAPGPTPPMPRIPPRPLDWPPDEGVPVPDQSPAGVPSTGSAVSRRPSG